MSDSRFARSRKHSLRVRGCELASVWTVIAGDNFGLSACGGTHTPTTGRVGVIAVSLPDGAVAGEGTLRERVRRFEISLIRRAIDAVSYTHLTLPTSDLG